MAPRIILDDMINNSIGEPVTVVLGGLQACIGSTRALAPLHKLNLIGQSFYRSSSQRQFAATDPTNYHNFLSRGA